MRIRFLHFFDCCCCANVVVAPKNVPLPNQQTKWEGFSGGTRMVRYDEADKIMFDIIKDDWNEFGSHSNTSIRIPTLRTLPGYIDKLRGKPCQGSPPPLFI